MRIWWTTVRFPSDCKAHSGSLPEFLSLQIRAASSRPYLCITTAKASPERFGSEETSTVLSELFRWECLHKFTSLSGFDMDRHKKEGEHGVTTVRTQEEFRTDNRHHTIIIAPEYQDFIKDTTDTLQVDVAFIHHCHN